MLCIRGGPSGEDDNWDRSRRGIPAQDLTDPKAVYVWQHQIEKNQIGPLRLNAVQCLSAARSCVR